jgi:hypothetical protein
MKCHPNLPDQRHWLPTAKSLASTDMQYIGKPPLIRSAPSVPIHCHSPQNLCRTPRYVSIAGHART